MDATVNNMKAHGGGPGVFAWSPDTDEQCSADPGDYFYMDPDEPLVDSEGNPMQLARRVSFVELVGDPDTYEDYYEDRERES